MSKGYRKDLKGQRFGRLTVIEFEPNNKNRAYWKCRCDCGNIAIVAAYDLMHGRVKSCRCLLKECSFPTRKTHGFSYTRLYHCWIAMRHRCNHQKYKNYGGRGIKVCKEWEDSFEAFRDWAFANGYDDTLTIDRIDVNGNYEPSNCRWADSYTQCRNRRDNHYIECFGKKQILEDWVKETGISANAIKNRIKKGWSIEKALSTPAQKYKK